jgi:hypothetical protein
MKKLLSFLGIAAFAAALAITTPSPAHAFLDGLLNNPDNGAPEIDPSAIGSAVALALGGAVMLRDRIRR